MGTLLPEDFPLASLKNDAERMVVEALCDRLNDSWVVLPSVGLSDGDRDREIDVVIAHPRDGVAVVEVKGHRPVIRGGRWYAHRREPSRDEPTIIGPAELGDRLGLTSG